MNPEPAVRANVLSPLATTLLMGAAAACLFCGYEFVRSTANTLFKAAYGKEWLPAVMAVMPLALVAMLYGYGRLLSRRGARRSLLASTLISAAAIGVCYVALGAGIAQAAIVLIVLRELYVVLICEQYWSFMDSTFGTETARKFNGLFCGIGSLGSIVGAYGVGTLSVPLGTRSMLVFGALLLLPAAFFSDRAYRECGEPAPRAEETRSKDHLGLSLFREQPLLILLLFIIMATQEVATVLDLSFQWMLQDQIPNPDQQNAFSGMFFAWLNAAAAAGQFVVSPFLLRFVPLRVVLLLIPFAHVATCANLYLNPTLWSAGLAFFLFKAIDYSVFRTAKEILYIPFSFDVRYRAKEIIDVFGYRFGKGWSSLAITIAQSRGIVFTNLRYAVLALGGAAVWFALTIPIFRRGREKP